MTTTATAIQRNTMTQIHLIEREVKKIPFGSGTYLDKTMRGFMLVSNAVSKSYVFQRKIKGRSVRVTLGRVGEITAEEARDGAMAAWLQMKQGINPNEQKRENRVRGMTLRDAFRLFMSSEPRSAKTIELYESSFDRHLARWEDRTMEDIGNDRAGVRKLHETTTAAARSGLAKQKVKCGKEVPEHAGQATANNVMRLLKGIYNRARVEVPSLPEDPTINVNWHKDRVRNTSLRVDELRDWFEKVEALQNSIKRDYWISVILTGGRRSQIAESEWEHIDFDKATWHFPKPGG